MTVGVAVDFKCPRNVELFVLGTDDDIVWLGVAPIRLSLH
jgi:hypothetical protein